MHGSVLAVGCLVATKALPAVPHGGQGASNSEESPEARDIVDLSLEEMLSGTVTLPTKDAQPLFNSPLSVTTLSGDTLRAAGIGTVAEALRLIPGTIVREQATDVHTVHVRGFESVPAKLPGDFRHNRLMLVMIDGRIVTHDYFGDTPWMQLPISIEEIESIEVVRGPASALYGPNAAVGVVNIRTRRTDNHGPGGAVSIDGASAPTSRDGAITGARAFGKLRYGYADGSVSLVLAHRLTPRFDSRYVSRHARRLGDAGVYDEPDDFAIGMNGQRVPMASLVDMDKAYPDPREANRQSYGKLGFNHRFAWGAHVDLDVGVSQGRTQGTGFADLDVVGLMQAVARSRYANLRASHGELRFRAEANQDVYRVALEGPLLGVLDTSVDARAMRMVLDYALGGEHYTLRPSLELRRVHQITDGYSGGSGGWWQRAAALRGDVHFGGVATVAALRVDDYTAMEGRHPSWQLAATYDLGQRALFRIVVGRASQGPTARELFTDFETPFARVVGVGDTYQPRRVDSSEIGARARLPWSLELDAEAFVQRQQRATMSSAAVRGGIDDGFGQEERGRQVEPPRRI